MENSHYELINEYLDWYENLLTEKQKDVMNMYFREDYSLKEIADNLTISRSAVSDLIKRVEATLENYELKLNLVAKFHARSKIYDELGKMDDNQIQEITKKLIEIE